MEIVAMLEKATFDCLKLIEPFRRIWRTNCPNNHLLNTIRNDDKPMTVITNQHRAILQKLANKAMIDRGLFSDFSAKALAELDRIQAPATWDGKPIRDLRDLLWASIDNDDSLNLDRSFRLFNLSIDSWNCT
jgi:hypothetical protein